ncbi:sigma-70 family RNA polymerase sigma factor [Labrenzia suaedae]|uniref:RNA polymerase sigma factor n=2 Tax=Roseibium litorale TaxID=2803841 RepID=A0ABR9CKP5_9HYPH|nr:sigma-70 family RNA polymerase sigma factor [Roseibium litorale]MBD8891318.1 sigma-70 family RNA polymerase sigma factor [Roseibium litorale]
MGLPSVKNELGLEDELKAGAGGSAGARSLNLLAVSDEELLELIRRDSEVAFRTLIDRHVDRGYAVAYRILRNASDAEDVVQDAFLQVWTKRAVWQAGRARFSTWLYRVISNRCIDLLRRPKVETMETLPELEDDRGDQMQSLARQEASEMLQKAMAKLPDQQRIALVFSYTENLSNGEIAEIMETSVSAVEALLKRGRQKLRHLLRNTGGEILSIFTKY